jgi:phosphatidylinositol/phosphatidylcholine transfer protein
VVRGFFLLPEKGSRTLECIGYFVPDRHDDTMLLRFLRARKFDLIKAKEMFIAAEEWRKSFGVDDIVQYVAGTVCSLMFD